MTNTKPKNGDYLIITDGKVVSKRALDRGAGDLPAIQITRAEAALWSFKDEQGESALESIETI